MWPCGWNYWPLIELKTKEDWVLWGAGGHGRGENQMQSKHERFSEEAQLQVGVWAASAVYGAAELKVSPSQGALCCRPPNSTPTGCCPLPGSMLQTLWSTCTPFHAAGQNRILASGDSGILGLAALCERGRPAPQFRSQVWEESTSASSIISMPLHRPSVRRRSRQW